MRVGPLRQPPGRRRGTAPARSRAVRLPAAARGDHGERHPADDRRPQPARRDPSRDHAERRRVARLAEHPAHASSADQPGCGGAAAEVAEHLIERAGAAPRDDRHADLLQPPHARATPSRRMPPRERERRIVRLARQRFGQRVDDQAPPGRGGPARPPPPSAGARRAAATARSPAHRTGTRGGPAPGARPARRPLSTPGSTRASSSSTRRRCRVPVPTGIRAGWVEPKVRKGHAVAVAEEVVGDRTGAAHRSIEAAGRPSTPSLIPASIVAPTTSSTFGVAVGVGGRHVQLAGAQRDRPVDPAGADRRS